MDFKLLLSLNIAHRHPHTLLSLLRQYTAVSLLRRFFMPYKRAPQPILDSHTISTTHTGCSYYRANEQLIESYADILNYVVKAPHCFITSL